MSRGALLACALAIAGCGVERLEDHPCPPGGTTLTYESFGEQFFATYCTRCHGGPNGYSSRAYTTVEAIRADRERIFANAAGDNTTMPVGPNDPPEKLRRDLADWLACGAP